MRLERFLDAVAAEWPPGSADDGRRRFRRPAASRQCAALPTAIPGLSSENILVLLNHAAATLEPDEVAVEIGLLHGLTLVGTALGNAHVPIYGCDDFSRIDASPRALGATLDRFVPDARIHVSAMDFREFLRRAPWGPCKVGLFFYDGPHTADSQCAAILGILPHLADPALVIVDDANTWAVRAGLHEVERLVPTLRPIWTIRTWTDHDRLWWNGVAVYAFTGHCPPGVGSVAHARSQGLRDWSVGTAHRLLTLPFWLPGMIGTLARSFSHRIRESRHGESTLPPSIGIEGR